MDRTLTPSEIWRFHHLNEVPTDYLAEIKIVDPIPTPPPPESTKPSKS